jgi:hypothetical protein
MLAWPLADPLKMTAEERVLEAYYERLPRSRSASRVIAVEFSRPTGARRRRRQCGRRGLPELQQRARHDQTRMAGQWLGAEIEDAAQVAEAEAGEQFRGKSNLFIGITTPRCRTSSWATQRNWRSPARRRAEAEAKAN